MFGTSRAVVGLDIGSSAVKAVELKAVGRACRVAAFGVQPVPPESIVDGAIIDRRAVADAIRRVFESDRAFGAKDVCTSLSGNAAIVKTITLPIMTQSELDERMYWEVGSYIPFDIQEVNLDCRIVGSGAGPESEGTMDVLLVAAKKSRVWDCVDVIAQAGRTPAIVDVDSLALQNAYEINYGLEPGQVVAILDAGASETSVIILQGDRPVFVRGISTGGHAYTQALQEDLGVPREVAERLKKGISVDEARFEEAQPVLRAVTERLLVEIQRTFVFFKATASSDRIDRIVVSGGASRVDGFLEMIQDRFDTPVERFDPFRSVTWDAGNPDVDLAEAASTAAVAVGLALRRVGDR